jgi:hypothetical protein
MNVAAWTGNPAFWRDSNTPLLAVSAGRNSTRMRLPDIGGMWSGECNGGWVLRKLSTGRNLRAYNEITLDAPAALGFRHASAVVDFGAAY